MRIAVSTVATTISVTEILVAIIIILPLQLCNHHSCCGLLETSKNGKMVLGVTMVVAITIAITSTICSNSNNHNCGW